MGSQTQNKQNSFNPFIIFPSLEKKACVARVVQTNLSSLLPVERLSECIGIREILSAVEWKTHLSVKHAVGTFDPYSQC